MNGDYDFWAWAGMFFVAVTGLLAMGWPLSPKGHFFGVPVPDEFRGKREVRELLRNYRVGNAVVMAAAAAVLLVIKEGAWPWAALNPFWALPAVLMSQNLLLNLFLEFGRKSVLVTGAFGGLDPATLAEARRWKLGLLYFNRSNRALFVRKPFGSGYSPNLGHPVVGVVFFVIVVTSLLNLPSFLETLSQIWRWPPPGPP